MSKFIIQGPCVLNGTIKVSGSKNAALPIMAASVLNDGITVLKNVPNISDIWTMISIFEFLNIKVDFKDNTLTIDTKNMENQEIPHDLVKKLRGAIVLIGPLLARFGEVKIAFPGGCVIGKRPISSHLSAFEAMGCKIIEARELIHIKVQEIRDFNLTLEEISVTATENAIAFATLNPNTTNIALCASEPHVQDLCHFLEEIGAKITGTGTHFLSIKGIKKCNRDISYSITPDYLEVGTFAVGAAITGGHVIIKGAIERHLDSFWNKMKEAGVKFKHSENEVEIFPSHNLKAINIKTGVYPSFATDLQAPFSLIQCKAQGVSKIFETLFEKRLGYLFELEKMGAHIEETSPYKAMIVGGNPLKATQVSSCDLRAGAAMVLAALIAHGETEVLNIYYIDRGYENFETKLKQLGAKIERIN